MSQSLTEQEYVTEHRHFFRRLHLHDGVWWNQAFPGYAKTAFQFHALVPGSARPAPFASLLGYRHHVPASYMGNQTTDYMVLEGENLRRFGLERLDANTRNHVRKGLKRCEIRQITELEPYLEELREVCVSHSKRLAQHRQSYHVHHTFFIEQADSWRGQVRRDFRSRGRRWWAAFSGKHLVGYIVTLQVANLMMLEKVKFHAEGLRVHVADALYFSVLERAAKEESCQKILNSTPQREGLDRFKRHYLFNPTPIPFYVSNLSLFRFATRMGRMQESLAMSLVTARRMRSQMIDLRADNPS